MLYWFFENFTRIAAIFVFVGVMFVFYVDELIATYRKNTPRFLILLCPPVSIVIGIPFLIHAPGSPIGLLTGYIGLLFIGAGIVGMCATGIISISYRRKLRRWQHEQDNYLYHPKETAKLTISHITFVVQDLEKTATLWKSIFGAQEVYSTPTVKYFQLNDLWIALNKGDPLPHRTYNHIAFQIPASKIDSYTAKIKSAGAEIKPDRPRTEGEGTSIYFYDYDNHLFELHTGTLAERLRGCG
jgi:catechol 2,3-dioxygenase-like lactoylglutathione lyase family enzyme